MSLTPALAAARALHFAAATGLFGAAMFAGYTGPAAPPGLDRTLSPWLRGLALMALASGAAWFLLTAAGMAGDPSGAVDPDTLALVGQTEFGGLWSVRMVLAGVLAILPGTGRPAGLIPLLSGLLLGSLALTGHATEGQGALRAAHMAADAAHLLAAGLWLGGLLVLGLVLKDERAPAPMLQRFSGAGYVAVAALTASGVVNCALMLGSFAALATTGYGRLLMVKLALVAGMLALAAANRLWITPALAREPGPVWLKRIRRHVLAEQVLGLAVLAVVGLLGTLDPSA